MENVKITTLEMLPNGDHTRAKNYRIVENTTAFDVVIYSIFCYATDNDDFKMNFEAVFGNQMRNFMEEFIKTDMNRSTKRSRDLVLLSIFKIKNNNKMKILNCRATVLEMLCTFWKFISFNCTCKQTIGIELGSKSFFDVPDACDSNHVLVFVDVEDCLTWHNSIPQTILINGKVFATLYS